MPALLRGIATPHNHCISPPSKLIKKLEMPALLGGIATAIPLYITFSLFFLSFK